MSWTRRQRRPFETFGVIVATSVLVVAPLVAAAAPATAADAPVLSSTFDGGTYPPWVTNGGATLALVAENDGRRPRDTALPDAADVSVFRASQIDGRSRDPCPPRR